MLQIPPHHLRFVAVRMPITQLEQKVWVCGGETLCKSTLKPLRSSPPLTVQAKMDNGSAEKVRDHGRRVGQVCSTVEGSFSSDVVSCWHSSLSQPFPICWLTVVSYDRRRLTTTFKKYSELFKITFESQVWENIRLIMSSEFDAELGHQLSPVTFLPAFHFGLDKNISRAKCYACGHKSLILSSVSGCLLETSSRCYWLQLKMLKSFLALSSEPDIKMYSFILKHFQSAEIISDASTDNWCDLRAANDPLTWLYFIFVGSLFMFLYVHFILFFSFICPCHEKRHKRPPNQHLPHDHL